MVGKTELIFSISEKAISFALDTSDTPSLTLSEGSLRNRRWTASVSSVTSGLGSSKKRQKKLVNCVRQNGHLIFYAIGESRITNSLLSVVLVELELFLSTKSREMFKVWWEIKGKVACGSGSSLSSCKSYTSKVRVSEVLEVPINKQTWVK